jgi:hypothetical protein
LRGNRWRVRRKVRIERKQVRVKRKVSIERKQFDSQDKMDRMETVGESGGK